MKDDFKFGRNNTIYPPNIHDHKFDIVEMSETTLKRIKKRFNVLMESKSRSVLHVPPIIEKDVE